MKPSRTGVFAAGIAVFALLVAWQFAGDPLINSNESSASSPSGAAAPSASPASRPVATNQPAPASGTGVLRFVIDAGASKALYRVEETFIREGNRLNTAVGVTQVVRGEIRMNRADPRQSTIGPITVDISQFRSDSGRRDNAIRDRWLESARFPNAQFTTTAIRGLPSAYKDGETLHLQIRGALNVRDVTRPVTFDATVKVNGSTLTGTATAKVKMTDFGFDPPSILGILRAENDVTIELQITARAQ